MRMMKQFLFILVLSFSHFPLTLFADEKESITVFIESFFSAWKRSDYKYMYTHIGHPSEKIKYRDFLQLFLIKYPNYDTMYFNPLECSIASIDNEKVNDDRNGTNYNIQYYCNFAAKDIFGPIKDIYIYPQDHCNEIKTLLDDTFSSNAKYTSLVFINQLIIMNRFNRDDESIYYLIFLDPNDFPNIITIGNFPKHKYYSYNTYLRKDIKYAINLEGYYKVRNEKGNYIILNFVNNNEQYDIMQYYNRIEANFRTNYTYTLAHCNK